MDIGAIETIEASTPREAIVSGDGTASTDYLDGLRSATRPLLEEIVVGLQAATGLSSEVSDKRAATAREKVLRPQTLARYPWFTLAHLRDYLRFRTRLHRASDFVQVMARFVALRDAGVLDIVKIDTAKLVRPGAFGWRMIATDLRFTASGLLVEHYMTFDDMIAVNEEWLHKVYEKWRSSDTDELTTSTLRAFERDAAFSTHAYRELLHDGILRGVPGASAERQGRAATGEAIVGRLLDTLSLR